jgi:2-keto-3-deoxy-L-rhamnonate aldolase RhmA
VNAEAVAPYAAQGYTLLVAGVDVLFLGNGARRILKDMQAYEKPMK